MFTPQIYNPNPKAIPATELQIKDRIITNNELKDFFTNIPKRLDLIENADDVSNNIDVLELTETIDSNTKKIDELNDDLEFTTQNVQELLENVGIDDYTSGGTLNKRVNKLWQAVMNEGALMTMVFEHDDELANLNSTIIPNINEELNSHQNTMDQINEKIQDLERHMLNCDNKSTQIEVNTAAITTNEQKINQLRTESNNNYNYLMDYISSLEQQIKELKEQLEE